MANKIKLAGTTSNSFQIGLQGITLSSNRATAPYSLNLPANTGSTSQVLIIDSQGNLDWSNSAINAGTVTTNAQPNITSLGILANLSITGNANIGNVNIESSIVIANGTGGNILGVNNISANTAIFSDDILLGSGNGGSLLGANLISANFLGGTIITASQPNITSLGALASLSVSGNANIGNIGVTLVTASGNITGSRLISTIATGNAPLIVTSTTQVPNLRSAFSNVANTVSVGAQPNITSVGNLSNVFVTGTANVGNLVIRTNGTANIVGNANIGNISTTGLITATGNIQGGNLRTNQYLINSVQTGISAAGTTQGTATALGNTINIVSTVTSGANSVILPVAVSGLVIYITNTTSDTLNVFPASNASIGFGSANAAYVQAANSTINYIAASTTQWYIIGAIS
jgi:hypothetical protein